MDLDILDVTIFDGHALRPENRVSIRNGLISEIGTGTAESPADRTITATGRLLTPGFVDAHVHTTFGGQESLACDISADDGLDETLDTIRRYADALAAPDSTSTAGWVTGGGWSMADFPGGNPTAEILDAACPDSPAVLLSADHHSAWVNHAAMSLAGIDASTPDPEGGVIVRDEAGEPTGCLHEAAIDLVGAHVPFADDATILAGLRAGYMIASPEVAAAVAKCVIPFAVNSPAQTAALAALEAEDEMRRRVALVVAERERTLAAAREHVPGIPDTQANFFWLPLGEDAARFAAHCESQGILVRPFAGDGVRVTLGRSEDNDRALEAIRSFAEA